MHLHLFKDVSPFHTFCFKNKVKKISSVAVCLTAGILIPSANSSVPRISRMTNNLVHKKRYQQLQKQHECGTSRHVFVYFTFHVRVDSCRDCLLSPPKSIPCIIPCIFVWEWLFIGERSKAMIALGTNRVSDDVEGTEGRDRG